MSERTPRARALRQTATLPEQKLWAALRGSALGATFRRQTPIDQFFADFACFEGKLVVELDGPVHEGRELDDQARTDALEMRGWHVIRFSNARVMDDLHGVLGDIARALRR